ncbi:MAG: glycosyltransferase [Smithellaceae bacterium]|nr:glycosyltransferase [Smithellaceae bacterium]
MVQTIRQLRPDVIHVHNVYPLFSPSVLVAARNEGIPTVMTCHNFRLLCPIGTHFRKGKICELCAPGNEYWCLLQNCRQNLFESLAFFLRNWTARKMGIFRDNVTIFITVNPFLKERLCQSYLPEDRVFALPNMVPLPADTGNTGNGEYVAFSGRISPEKGIKVFLEALANNPELPGYVAGDCSSDPSLIADAPRNVKFAGRLDGGALESFYRRARFLVVPSLWYETFGLVAAEAMSYGIPVIASRIGALPGLVEDGVNGLLFEPGNALSLADKVKFLWNNPDLCRQMGQRGQEKIREEYSEDVIFARLMKIYERAIEIGQAKNPGKVKP